MNGANCLIRETTAADLRDHGVHSAVPPLLCRLDFWQGTGVGGVQLSGGATGLRIGGSTGRQADKQSVPSTTLYTMA